MTEVSSIELTQLTAHPDNARSGVGDVDELAASIAEVGVLQPILVTIREDHFVILAGHRRVAASLAAGLTHVPAIVREDLAEQLDDQRSVMMVENIHRSDLSTEDKARGFQSMVDAGLSQREIATRCGVNQSTVARALEHLRPADAAKAVRKAKVEKPKKAWIGEPVGFMIVRRVDDKWVSDWDAEVHLTKEGAATSLTEACNSGYPESIVVACLPTKIKPVLEVTIDYIAKTDRYVVTCSADGVCGRNTTLEYAEDRKRDHLWEVHGVAWDPDRADAVTAAS